jgi:hypothetical protein
MVHSRQPHQGSESHRDQDRDQWPHLTDADREYLSVKRRERLQDIVSKTCGPVIKSAMQHHVSVFLGGCRGGGDWWVAKKVWKECGGDGGGGDGGGGGGSGR